MASLSRLRFALWDYGKAMLGVSVHREGLGAGKAAPEGTPGPAEGPRWGTHRGGGGCLLSQMKGV